MWGGRPSLRLLDQFIAHSIHLELRSMRLFALSRKRLYGRGACNLANPAKGTLIPPIIYNFFLQKQPKNRLSSPKTTHLRQNTRDPKWHFSYPQPGIMNIES